MIPRDSSIGKRVRMMWGTGGVRGYGKVIGYPTKPTFIVELDDGRQVHWVAELVEEDPDGAPKHTEWSDRMAQELQVAGSSIGALQMFYRDPSQREVAQAWANLGSALHKLDAIRDEIINSGDKEVEE